MAQSADDLQKALGGLHLNLEDTFNNFWRTLNLVEGRQLSLEEIGEIRTALLEFLPMLTDSYGSKAASLAADWYDELRVSQKVPGQFVAELGEVIEARWVHSRVRFGASHLHVGAFDQYSKFLTGAITGWVTEAFANTMQRNSYRDPQSVGWARKPEPNACKFCLMLASRGAVYSSAKSAGVVQGRGTENYSFVTKRGKIRDRGEGVQARGKQAMDSKFHDHCRCLAVPVWPQTDVSRDYGFDPEELEDRYLKGEFDKKAPDTHDREAHLAR